MPNARLALYSGLGTATPTPTPSSTPTGTTIPLIPSAKYIDQIGSLHNYQLGKNVSVELNLNLDLVQIMAATGSDFQHNGYLKGDKYSSKINDNIEDYFVKFIPNADAKAFYAIEAKESSSGRSQMIPGRVTSAALASKEFLKDDLLYNDGGFFSRSLFNSQNVSLLQFNEILRRFANDTDSRNFFKLNIDLYNQMIDTFITNTLNFNHVDRVQDFYEIDLSNNQFKIVLTSVQSGGSAIDIPLPDKTEVYYQIINPTGDLFQQLSIFYHVTAHNFYSTNRNAKYDV